MIIALHRTNMTLIYSGDQAEDCREDVGHVEESKSSTDSTGVVDSAGKKVKHESNDNGNACILKAGVDADASTTINRINFTSRSTRLPH